MSNSREKIASVNNETHHNSNKNKDITDNRSNTHHSKPIVNKLTGKSVLSLYYTKKLLILFLLKKGFQTQFINSSFPKANFNNRATSFSNKLLINYFLLQVVCVVHFYNFQTFPKLLLLF